MDGYIADNSNWNGLTLSDLSSVDYMRKVWERINILGSIVCKRVVNYKKSNITLDFFAT